MKLDVEKTESNQKLSMALDSRDAEKQAVLFFDFEEDAQISLLYIFCVPGTLPQEAPIIICILGAFDNLPASMPWHRYNIYTHHASHDAYLLPM